MGYYYSFQHLGTDEEIAGSRWCLPLSAERLPIEVDKVVFARNQLSGLLSDEGLPFQKAARVINKADSEYGCVKYISPLVDLYDNLLIVTKLRHGMKVYQMYEGEQKPMGRAKVYGESYLAV